MQRWVGRAELSDRSTSMRVHNSQSRVSTHWDTLVAREIHSAALRGWRRQEGRDAANSGTAEWNGRAQALASLSHSRTLAPALLSYIAFT